MPIDLPSDLTSALREGRQAYVAVPSKDGPHVTPELYAWSDGRIWFAAATSTLKAKVLDRDARGGVLVSSGGRSVVLAGPVDIYDPRQARGLAAAALRMPRVAKASASFVVRNASDMVGFVSDAVRGRLGTRPIPLRVLFALEPDRAAMVENDRVVGAWGDWNAPARSSQELVPPGGETAVLAVPGPFPLPGRWFADEDEFFVAPDLLALLALGERFPASVVTDEYRRPGPAAKEGTLRRGEATQTARAGVISLSADRVVEWDGVETTSRDAEG